ncbi:MAG: hypothetical protein QGH45_21790 [Myxococcota bacterium]|nr:hypothetical protein [Myxococcota bacterium]
MRHAWTRGWTLGLGVALAVAAAGTAVAQPVEAQALRELYEKLMAPEIDTGRYLDVAGKTLAYEDLTVTFVVGAVHPVVRSDGKIMGLAFAGKGELTFDPPDARERQQVERHLKAVPYVHGFASAWIMATDDTVDRLLGEGGEWATGGGAPVRAENIHVSRHKLYRDKLWDEAGPSLEMDVLHDLYGDGFQGGHVFAEFAVDPVRWLTYYRNPRGALFAGEEVSVFTHAGRGAAPQTMDIYASYPSARVAPAARVMRPYDLAHVELTIDVPRSGPSQNLGQVNIIAEPKIAGLTDGVKAIALRLQSRKARCKGDEEYGSFKITALHDFEDQPIPAIHDRNRLFCVLRAPLNTGQFEVLKVEYGGDLLEAVTIENQTNEFYTPLQGYPWYPRSPWPDRHSLRSTVSVPRFMRGVVTGNLEEEVEDTENKKQIGVFHERGGVAGGMLAVGAYGEPLSDEVDGVRVLVYTTQKGRQLSQDLMDNTKAMIRYFGALWGPYPYSTLTQLEIQPLPMGNWQYDATESVSMTPEAGWTCSPPGQLYAWEGFALSDTACASFMLPATAPAQDQMQTHGLNYYFVDTPEASMAYTASVVARQWWGQFVGPASYREQWITEGAVMLSATLYLSQFRGRKARDNRIDALHDMALRRNASGSLMTGYRLGHDFPDVLWGKGPAVMQMLMDQIGGDPFVNMMRSVMNRCPNYGVTNELFRQVAGEYVGDELDPFWTYWIEGTDIPGVRSAFEVTDGEDGTFDVAGTLVFEDSVPPTPIPVAIQYSKKDIEYRMVHPTDLRNEISFPGLQRKPKKIEVDPNNLVLLRYRKPLKD